MLIQVTVDEEDGVVRLTGRADDQALASIAAAAMQAIISGSTNEDNKIRAAEVMRALGITRVEKISSD